MEETGEYIFIHIPPIFGIDLSVTSEVVLLWIAAFATFLLIFFACRRTALHATGGYQNFFESIIEFINKEVVEGVVGIQTQLWSPFILTVFFFILSCNLLGFVPLPGSEERPLFKPITSNINVTGILAAMVFFTTIIADVIRSGPSGFVKKLIPSGLPGWIIPLIFPLEIVTRLARPLSLTLRLFANMLAGHSIQAAFVSLGLAAAWYLKPVPYLGSLLMAAFELFVCFIQAFVFTILTGFYLKDALETTSH